MDAEKDVIVYRLESKIYELEAEMQRYKKNSEAARKNEFRIAGILFLIIGAITVPIAIISFNYSTLANALLMVGAGSLFLGAITVSLNTERFMNQKVAQNLNLSSVVVLDELLRDLRLANKGVYVPSSRAGGDTKVFIPLKRQGYQLPSDAVLKDVQAFVVGLANTAQEGLLLKPLGYHLFTYTETELKVRWKQIQQEEALMQQDAESRGAQKSALGKALRDVLVNGLEIAEEAAITLNGDTLHVQLHDTSYIALCRSIMREAPQVCAQIGCPLCSLIACVYTEYIDREVVIESVESSGRDIVLACKAC